MAMMTTNRTAATKTTTASKINSHKKNKKQTKSSERDVIWNCVFCETVVIFAHRINEMKVLSILDFVIKFIVQSTHKQMHQNQWQNRTNAPFVVLVELLVADARFVGSSSDVFNGKRFSSVLVLWNWLPVRDNCDARRNHIRGIELLNKMLSYGVCRIANLRSWAGTRKCTHALIL